MQRTNCLSLFVKVEEERRIGEEDRRIEEEVKDNSLNFVDTSRVIPEGGVLRFGLSCNDDEDHLYKVSSKLPLLTQEELLNASEVISNNLKAKAFYTLDTYFLPVDLEYANAVVALSKHYSPPKERVYYNTFLMGQSLLRKRVAKNAPWTCLKDLERDLQVPDQSYGDYSALHSLYPFIGPHCNSNHVKKGWYCNHGERVVIQKDNWRQLFMSRVKGRRAPPTEFVEDLKAMAIAERCLRFEWPRAWVFLDIEFISTSTGLKPFLLALYDGDASLLFELTVDRSSFSVTDYNVFKTKFPWFEQYVTRPYDENHNKKTWDTIRGLLALKHLLVKGGDNDQLILKDNDITYEGITDLGSADGPLFLSQDKLALLLPDRFNNKHDPLNDIKSWVKLISDVQTSLPPVKLEHVEGWCGIQMLYFLKNKNWTTDMLTLKLFKKLCPVAPTGTNLSRFRGSYDHTFFLFLKDLKHVDVYTNGSITIHSDKGFSDDTEYGGTKPKPAIRATDRVKTHRRMYVAKSQPESKDDRELSRQKRTDDGYEMETIDNKDQGSTIIYRGELTRRDYQWSTKSRATEPSLAALSKRFFMRPADIVTYTSPEGLYIGTGSRQLTCCVLAILIHLMWHPGYDGVETSMQLYFFLMKVWVNQTQFIDLEERFLTNLLLDATKGVEGLAKIVAEGGGIVDTAFHKFLLDQGINTCGARGEIKIVDMETSTGTRFKHAWYLLYKPTFRHPDTKLQLCLVDSLEKGNIPGFKRCDVIAAIKSWMYINLDTSIQPPEDILPYLSSRFRFSYKLSIKTWDNQFSQHIERQASKRPKFIYISLRGDAITGFGHYEFVRTELDASGPAAKPLRELENTIAHTKVQDISDDPTRLNLGEESKTQVSKPSGTDLWVTEFPIAHLKKTFVYAQMLNMYPLYDSNPVDGSIDVLQFVLITMCLVHKFTPNSTALFPKGVPFSGNKVFIHPGLSDLLNDLTDIIFIEWPQVQRTYYTTDSKRCITQTVNNNIELSYLVDFSTGEISQLLRLPLPYEFQIHHLTDLNKTIHVKQRIPIGDHIRIVVATVTKEFSANLRVLAALPVSSLADIVNDVVDSRQHFPLALPTAQFDAMKLWFLGTDVIKRAVAEPATLFADMVQFTEVITNSKPGSLDSEALRRAYVINLANNRYDRMLLDSTTSLYTSVWRCLMWAWERYGLKSLLKVPDSVIRGCGSDFMVTSVSLFHLLLAIYFLHNSAALIWSLFMVLIRGSIADLADSTLHFTISYWIYKYGYALMVPTFLEFWSESTDFYLRHRYRITIYLTAFSDLGHRAVQQRNNNYFHMQDDIMYIHGVLPSLLATGFILSLIWYVYQTLRHPTFFSIRNFKVYLLDTACHPLETADSQRSFSKRICADLGAFGIDLKMYRVGQKKVLYSYFWEPATKVYDENISLSFIAKYLSYVTKYPEHESVLQLKKPLVLKKEPANEYHGILQKITPNKLAIPQDELTVIFENFEGPPSVAMHYLCGTLTEEEFGLYLHFRLHNPALIMGVFTNKQLANGEFGLASCRRDVQLIADRAMGKQPYVPANQARIEKLYQIDPYSLPTLRDLTFRVGEKKVGWHTFLNTITQLEQPKKPSGEPVNLFDQHWNGVLPVRPDGRIINTLVALFNRHGSPPTLRDPTFNPHLEVDTAQSFKDVWKWDGEFIDEMGIKHPKFSYTSVMEYLNQVEPRKRASYVKGFANFKRRPRISKTLRAIPKNDESQYKKIHLHTQGLKTAIDSCKQRLIFNPSSELKANAGYVMHNIRKRIKRLPDFRFSSMTGRTPEEIERIMEWWYAYIDANGKRDNPEDEVVPLVYDGYQNDSTIDHLFIEQTDNVWIDMMFYRTCADLGYNVTQAEAIRRACFDINIPFTCQLQTHKERTYLRKKTRFNIAGTIRGSVVSGHSSRTSDGNTNRLIILLKRIGREVGLKFGYNFMVFQAGDDTKIFLPKSFVSRFIDQLKVYYTPFVEGMTQTVHGLGLCYQNLKVIPGQVDFLSKVGFLRPGYKAIMVREPSRVWKTGAYFDTDHLTLSEFNQALTYQLKSWVDPNKTLGYRTVLSYREYRKLSSSSVSKRSSDYADLMQSKTKKERYGLTLIPAYSLFHISPMLRVMESIKALHPRLLFPLN